MKYSDLINVGLGKQRETFEQERGAVMLYCRECESYSTYEDEKHTCPSCESSDTTIGTQASLLGFYKRKRKS